MILQNLRLLKRNKKNLKKQMIENDNVLLSLVPFTLHLRFQPRPLCSTTPVPFTLQLQFQLEPLCSTQFQHLCFQLVQFQHFRFQLVQFKLGPLPLLQLTVYFNKEEEC